MSHQQVRKDNTCQNCGKYVSNRYCSHCGQENIEVRYSFLGLIHHFVADLIHYDSSMWMTLRYLLTSPGKLAKDYLSGKRKTYVDPIKLYIFISFVTFFSLSLLSPFNIIKSTNQAKKIEVNINGIDKQSGKAVSYTVSSVQQLDSIDKAQNIKFIEYYTNKYILTATNNVSDHHKRELLKEFATHNLPKVLFIYMPIFAFWLWLFHYKQKKYYSDSGVFTLYLFSFILLLSTITIILNYLLSKVGLEEYFDFYITFFNILYFTWYFYKAHLYFFEERKSVSFIKTTAIGIIATILISFILLLYVLYVLAAI